MRTFLDLPPLHAGQTEALALRRDPRADDESLPLDIREQWAANTGKKRYVWRCGRRWGKTRCLSIKASNDVAKKKTIGWFAPDYKRLTEAYQEIKTLLKPITESASKIDGVIRTTTGGRIDFWTLNDENAGRSRFYHGVVIDEGAFTSDGPLEEATSMLATWERAIEPTLFDYEGYAIVASNTRGMNPENFLYAVCNDPKWGFVSYHAPTSSNPLLPIRRPGESEEEHALRRISSIEKIRSEKHPLVFKQEYEAEFVNWSGVAFFSLDKWLVNLVLDDQGIMVSGDPVALPQNCDRVFAVIDTASKTGTANDGTAVIYFARNQFDKRQPPLVILDWDVVQIEGDLLDHWLKGVVDNLDHYAKQCGSREGVRGLWIEDKSSGIVLLQQARKRFASRGVSFVNAIGGQWLTLGKDERALSVSAYHYQGLCKISAPAHNKTLQYKGSTRNHLEAQVGDFRVGDKDAAKRADDLLDSYVHSLALTFGDNKGF